MKDMNIGVPKSDLDKIGSRSIPIPGTDLYFAGLSVFHELHCIVSHSWPVDRVLLTCIKKRLRQYTWKDHYFPNITVENERLNRLHTGQLFRLGFTS